MVYLHSSCEIYHNWSSLLSIFDCSCWQTFIFLLNASDPNTVLTSITRGFEVTRDSNQDILVLTCDQQIYKIVVDITFHQPELLTGIVVILGGMHFLMDFVGCVGTLMADSDLKDIMSTSAGSILDISKYRDTCERSISILDGIAILRYIEYRMIRRYLDDISYDPRYRPIRYLNNRRYGSIARKPRYRETYY